MKKQNDGANDHNSVRYNADRMDVLHPSGNSRSPITEDIKLLHPDPAEFHVINGDNNAAAPYFTISNGGMNAESISVFDRMMQRESGNFLRQFLSAGCLSVILIQLVFYFLSWKIIGWIVILSLIPCIYLMFQKHLSVKKAQKLHGTVVGYKECTDSDCDIMYALIVEYGDHVGMKPTVISRTRTSSKRYMKKIGDQVIVLSYPDSTEKELFEERYIGYYIWLCVGIATGCFLFLYDFYI